MGVCSVANLPLRALGIIGWLALALSEAPATAQTNIAQWNFNSPLADSNVGTGTVQPSVRYGSASTIGGAIGVYASGDTGAGSTDPVTGDDSGWQLSGFPAQGAGSGQIGAEFAVNTTGYTSISIMFDLRASATSSRYWQLFYSTDGVNFVPSTRFSAASGGERWYNQQTVSLVANSAAAGNPNFKFRIAPVFDPALGTAYSAASPTSTYNPLGAYRLDMVTVLGSPTVPAPISGVATANPSATCAAGGQVRLQVAVTRGTNPNSSSLQVRANLTALGGSATASLFDNGQNGDPTPNDSVYSLLVTTPAGLSPGAKVVPITISDGQLRTATPQTTVTVADCSINSPSRVVISQVYGGGGNTSAPASIFNADYIELYNRSAEPVDLTGWSVQYAPPFELDAFADPFELVALSGSIRPGQRMLLLYTVPNAMGAALPTPDFVLPARVGLGHTGGRVALRRSTALLGAACTATDLEDFVGYGLAAACFEGAAPSATVDNNTAAIRKLGGAQDTDQSFNDFLAAAPLPSNRASGGFLAGYARLSAFGVCAGAPLTLSVDVAPATNTPGPSTGITVSVDLSALGGPASVSLTDQGANLFALTYPVPPSVAPGAKAVPVLVSDAQGRSDASIAQVIVGSCVNSASQVVISQVFAGGGNALASFSADFVELFNRSSQPVDLTGWSLQYAGADDPLGFIGAPGLLPLSGIIPAGGYRLIQTGPAGTVGAALPAPDLVAPVSLGIDNEFGRLALARTTSPLGPSCSAAAVEDLVAYGVKSICSEGVAPAEKLTNHQVLVRLGAGCQDNNQSAIDLAVVDGQTVTPRTSLSPINPCPIVPADGACCSGSNCSIASAAACTGFAASFAGVGTSCNVPGNLAMPCCKADFNHVGGVTIQDIFDYLVSYFALDPRADVNGISGVTVQDVFDYLAGYFAGCA